MNTKELIEALQKQDPSAPAGAAMKQVNAEAAAAATAALLTPDGIRKAHAELLAHAKTHTDSKGNGNDEPAAVAYNGIRSNVHAALYETTETPGPHPDDEGDPDLLHARQKAYGKKLWKRADEMIAAAGLGPQGSN